MKANTDALAIFMFMVILALSAAVLVHAVQAPTTVNVGGSPWGVAYDSGKAELYVVNSASDSVSVLSDNTHKVVATVTVGTSPYRDIYDSGKGEIFVTNYGANSVSIISDQTNKVIKTLSVGTSPSSFAYDPNYGDVYVANSGSGSVSVISDTSNSVVATVTVGSGPYDLDYDSVTHQIFVANAYSRSVSVISDSNNQFATTVSVGSGPLGVAYDPAVGEVYVANSVSGAVSVISDKTATVTATVTVGASPGPVVYDSGKGEIFVANRNDGTVSVISDTSNTVTATLAVGTKPYAEAYDSGTGEVIVTNYGDGTLSIIADSSSPSSSSSPSASSSPTPSAQSTSTPASSTSSPTSGPSSSPSIVQQVWVPKPENTAASVAVSAGAVGVVTMIFAALSNPLGAAGGKVAGKTKGLIPDNVKQWLEEIVSSRRETTAVEKVGSVFKPTGMEVLAYVVSIVVLGISFSYVKVLSLSQIWLLLPVFLATGVIVGFVQKFFTIVYLRRKGVWSEHSIWPLGLVLFLFTTFAFKVPFSSPTRSVHTEKFTKRFSAITAASEILISLAFAVLFFGLLKAGFPAIGDAGLSMCVIGSFFVTLPISPLSGKDIYEYSKSIWATLFATTLVIFAAWLLII